MIQITVQGGLGSRLARVVGMVKVSGKVAKLARVVKFTKVVWVMKVPQEEQDSVNPDHPCGWYKL